MMWVRGFAADYDEWAEHAGVQWSFNQIVKYFKQIENVAGAREPDEGVGGPLHISHQRSPHPLTAVWLQAVQQTGHAIERPNLAQPNGFSQTMVTQRRGVRWSAADAWLRPALRRRNLTLITNATVARVIFKDKQAVGVEFDNNGTRKFVRARREVVVSRCQLEVAPA
jgi:choline dehydrogenase